MTQDHLLSLVETQDLVKFGLISELIGRLPGACCFIRFNAK